MKKFAFLTLISLFVSCKIGNENSNSKTGGVYDSILFYYDISKNKNLSLDKRYHGVNKSLLFFKKRKKDTIYDKILYQKNSLLLSLNKYDSLQIFNNLLIKNALHVEDDLILGKQYYLMGYYYDEIAHIPDSAFNNYNLSKNYFKQIDSWSWVGKNLLSMGIIQKDQNDYFGSKETITESLQYLDSITDIKHISSCYSTLATSHRKLLNFQDAIIYYSKAIATTNSKKDKLIYKNNLAASYIDNEQYDNAISLLENLAIDSLLIVNKKTYARVLDNMAYVQWLSGKKEMEEIFLRPLFLRKQNNDKRGLIASYTHLGEYHIENNLKKATSYFDSVIHLSKILKAPKAEKDVLKHLMNSYPNNVDLRNRYVLLQDSLYKKELKVKTQFAKYKYDDKLDQESILRLEKEKAEKELEITQERTQKTISFFGSISLLLGLGFAFHYFKQRTKHLKQQNEIDKLEATYETEAALSRRLHDDFGAKINHSMILVQNEAEKPVLLDALDELYNQSRDFSREINEVETGLNYKNELFGMLRLQTPKNVKLYITGSKDIDWSSINALSKTVLHKVLRELMINMSKYSRATAVTLTFKKTPESLKINYSDNGVGASEMSMNAKNGLRNTEKRIQAIGGTIIFETEKGKGFKAEIKTPN